MNSAPVINVVKKHLMSLGGFAEGQEAGAGRPHWTEERAEPWQVGCAEAGSGSWV